MKEAQIDVHLDMDMDEEDKHPTSGTHVLNAALATFIDINEDFTQLHAIEAISEIEFLWPDLNKPDFTAYELYNLAQVLRQANIVVEQYHLRAFLVAWRVFDISIPSMDVAGKAELARDMVICQFGCVEKEVTINDDEQAITPSMQMDIDEDKENIQAPTSGSPSRLLFKTQKKFARQRQLKALISQTKRYEKRKREDDGMAIDLDDDEPEVKMEPVQLSAAEKEELTLQKLERKRKLEALGSKQKRRRYY